MAIVCDILGNMAKAKEWTENERFFVSKNWRTACDAEIGFILGRTAKAVGALRLRAGLTLTNARRTQPLTIAEKARRNESKELCKRKGLLGLRYIPDWE